MNYFKMLPVIIALFLVGCTTQRPLYLQDTSKKDTVLMKPVIVTETKTVKEIQWLRDTVTIVREVKVPGPAVMDTAALGEYLRTYRSGETQQIEQMLTMIASMQQLLNRNRFKSDSQRVYLQAKLDTTNKEKQTAQNQIATAKVIIYDLPIYIMISLIFLLLLALLVLQYLKSRLRKKRIEKSRQTDIEKSN